MNSDSPIRMKTPCPMNKIVRIFSLVSIFLSGLLHGAPTWDQLKESINARKSKLASMVTSGQLKESPSGYIESTTDDNTAATSLRDLENEDRRAIFALIAERSGASVGDVALRYAWLRMAGPPVAAPPPITPPPPNLDFVPVEPGSRLPLKVLTRAGATLKAKPEETADEVGSEIPMFTVFVVKAIQGEWMQLMDSVGKQPKGWLHSSKVVSWKHHMVVKFTSPGAPGSSASREKALFFKHKQDLADLFARDIEARRGALQDINTTMDNGSHPLVVAREPDGYVRVEDQFYVLPILDIEQKKLDVRQAGILKVAAVAAESNGSRPVPKTVRRQDVKLDIVFVMDLTRSMGPFVESTRQMLVDIVANIDDSGLPPEAVRFGLWGYRDDPEAIREAIGGDIEFLTKNFTPELQTIDEFIQTLENVKETKVDSVDYAEDVFAGVRDGIVDTRWRENALRNLILVGDAPGREPGESETECNHAKKPVGSGARMDIGGIRQMAADNKVKILPIYLESPEWKQFTPLGLKQFRALSTDSFCRVLAATDSSAYLACSMAYSNEIIRFLKAEIENTPLTAPALPTPNDDDETAFRKMAGNIFRNAMLEIRTEDNQPKPPTDFEAWVSDKDLLKPTRATFEPCVLLTRREINELGLKIQDLVDAYLNLGVQDPQEKRDFFETLQTVVAIGGRDPGRLAEAEDLRRGGYFSDLITGLPYNSKILGMSREEWSSLGSDKESDLIKEFQSKLRYYRELDSNATQWTQLGEQDTPEDYVCPVLIEMLP